MITGLVLPYPPTINHYYHVAPGGRRFLRPEGREYRRTVFWICQQQRAHRFGARPVNITAEVHPPDRRRRDVDNVLKALLDALEAARVIDNDSQIRALTARKLDPWDRGAVFLTVAAADV